MGREGGLDIVWMEEATEFEEEDYNEILGRMRGKAAPWRQIILSCNPDGPAHWINVRLILGGEASVYFSSALDNPHNPESYVKSLSKMTGVQKERLVKGRWVLGSGVIFDTWLDDYNAQTGLSSGNVTKEADYAPDNGDVVWAVDDGYSGKQDRATGIFTGKSHPRAILLCQLRNDGLINVFAESYKIEALASDHVADILSWSKERGWPAPVYVVRDRAAASLEGALKENNIKVVRYNTQLVEESIKELRSWLAPDDNNVRRVLVHPRCRHLRYEMAQFSTDSQGRVIKEHDNGADALRYLVWDEAYGADPRVDIVSFSMIARNRNGS
jgi:phage terminase large subunit